MVSLHLILGYTSGVSFLANMISKFVIQNLLIEPRVEALFSKHDPGFVEYIYQTKNKFEVIIRKLMHVNSFKRPTL